MDVAIVLFQGIYYALIMLIFKQKYEKSDLFKSGVLC